MSDLLSIEQIRRRLEPMQLSKVEQATGVHRNTLYAIRNGKNTEPSYQTIRKLSEYLQQVAQ